ncbi:MAG TPA: methyltransferase, TIGR04325 family [bacterium]|nr:methyltransferase, TIGR04325 family [bacterium]
MTRLKRAVALLLPPIVVTALRRLLRWVRGARSQGAGSSFLDGTVEWEVVPESEWTTTDGWSHPSVVKMQTDKWPGFLASIQRPLPLGVSHEAPAGAPVDVSAHNTILTFGYVLGRAAAGRTALSVLDWGGGIGQYAAYAHMLHPQLQLDYVVKDLPAAVEAGRELVPMAAFVSDDEQALGRSYDLVFASSSLQYHRDVYGCLNRLCESAAGWLMVTRTPFVDQADDFVVVQRPHRYGYLTEYTGWFLNRQRFEAAMNGQGFELEREFLLDERPYVPNAPEQCTYRGFLFKRRPE